MSSDQPTLQSAVVMAVGLLASAGGNHRAQVHGELLTGGCSAPVKGMLIGAERLISTRVVGRAS